MKKFRVTVAQAMMLQRIYDYAYEASNVGVTTSIPALVTALSSLNSQNTTIEAMLAQYAVIIKGITDAKKESRVDLATHSYTIMKAVYSYAKATDDDVLAAEMKTSLSKLKYMAYPKLRARISSAIDAVQPILSSLGNYNVSAATFGQWQSLYNTYEQIINTPQSAIKNHKKLGQDIDAAVEVALDLTRDTIDGLVSSLMQTEPSYFRGYFIQRQTLIFGIRHTRAVVTVVNDLGEPFVGATVTVDELTKVVDQDTQQTRTFKAVSSTTDINGQVSVEKFEQGNRTITISGNDVVTKTFGPFYFEHGKAVVKVFTCEPAFNNLPAPKTTTWKEKVSK